MSLGDRPDIIGVDDASFEEFVAGSSGRLFTVAILLTGRHRAEAEDLLQDVLERAYRRWGRITRKGDPEPYVRQMLVNAAADRWRRLRYRREEPLALDSVVVPAGDEAGEAADRDVLLRALAMLPPRQRAVLVLRYFQDLSEAQTAAIMGCSIGTVKSQSSRALAKLREISAASNAGKRAGCEAAPDGRRQKGLGSHG
ncbi:MAG TPA: SigE family RNA polymerase sigma factor [Streptosporangiaceae bacterium]